MNEAQKQPDEKGEAAYQLTLKGRFAKQLRSEVGMNSADAEEIADLLLEELVEYMRANCPDDGSSPALILQDDDTLETDGVFKIPERLPT